MTITTSITESNTKYKIIKNYVKYLANNDPHYINKIINIIPNNNLSGGNPNSNSNSNSNINYDKIKFIIKNIDLIINDIKLFNKSLGIINKYDDTMSIINSTHKKFNYSDNILDYINKISKNDFIFN